jgi:hypothetical protein
MNQLNELADWATKTGHDPRFLYGCLGAFAAEVISLFNAYKRARPPKRVCFLGYWITWFFVILIGGVVSSTVIKDEHPMVATWIGASIVVLIQKWTRDTPA